MNYKFDVILEYVRDIPEMKQDIHELKERMDKNDRDHETMMALLRAHSQDIESLKRIHPGMRH
jgi:hypothetical protein